VNDKSANFLAVYYKVLKHERSLSLTEPPWVCLLLWPPLCLYICQLSPRKFYTLSVLYFIPYLHAI